MDNKSFTPPRNRTTNAIPTFMDKTEDSQLRNASISNSFSNPLGEISRTRNELNQAVQMTHRQQESKIKDIENELMNVQRIIQPKINKIENTQKLQQTQVENIRNEFQKLMSNDITPLHQQVDQIERAFDRFEKNELDPKLSPIKAEIESIGNLLRTHETKKKDREKELNDRFARIKSLIDDAQKSLQERHKKFTTMYEKREPQLKTIETSIKEYLGRYQVGPDQNSSMDNLEKDFSDIQNEINSFDEEVLQKSIRKATTTIISQLNDYGNTIRSEISDMENKIGNFQTTNMTFENEERDIEKSINTVSGSFYEYSNRINSLTGDIEFPLNSLSSEIENLGSQFQKEITDPSFYGSFQSALDQSQNFLQEMIGYANDLLTSLSDEFKDKAQSLYDMQSENIEAINNVLKKVYGEGFMVHLEHAEKLSNYCVDAITKMNDQRKEAIKMHITSEEVEIIINNIQDRIKAVKQKMSSNNGSNTLNGESLKSNSRANRKPAEDDNDEPQPEPVAKSKRKRPAASPEPEPEEIDEPPQEPAPKPKRKKPAAAPEPEPEENDEPPQEPAPKPKRKKTAPAPEPDIKEVDGDNIPNDTPAPNDNGETRKKRRTK